jgi:GR25 family glycosyltransferase involved in LPS biosynthesis
LKKFIPVIFILIILVIGYEFIYSKLFPYSPIVLGFSKFELKNVVVYMQKGADYIDINSLDSLPLPVEKFHELKFLKKPELYVFRDSLEYIHHGFSKARFCAYTSGRLFISPWALQESKQSLISLPIYIRHELSHVLIFQHKGVFDSFHYPDWLLEGIAVYSTNQMGTSFYPSKAETYKAIKDGNFMPPEYFKTSNEDGVTLKVKYRITFMYSEFACIVDYLIKQYGKEKFLVYMKTLFNDNNHDKMFKRVYGIDFSKSLNDFRKFAASQK